MLCGVDIVIVQESKIQHLKPAVYANILKRLLLIWFWLTNLFKIKYIAKNS